MVHIDDLISEMKSLYHVQGTIRFCHPAYEKFHQDLMDFIYGNHFENTHEWEIISQNLVYKSTQFMAALKEVNSRIKKLYKKYRGEEKDGQDLMHKAFTVSNPLLIFEGMDTESGRNVQEGYMQIFAGAMQGIRNPKAHENMSISREDAVKRLVLASLLMDKIDEAIRFTNLSE